MKLRAFCVACVMALTASAAYAQIQTYYLGGRMPFTRGEYRLECKSRDTIYEFVRAVAANFDYGDANTLLMRPLIDSVGGGKDFHPALKSALDEGLRQRVIKDCFSSSTEVFLAREHESVWFGEHKLSVVEVGTTDDRPYNVFVWLFDVDVVPPRRGSEEAERYWRMRGVSAYR